MITKEQAHESLQRFIDGHFNNPMEHPRISIPARPDRDDDLLLKTFIDDTFTRIAELEATLKAPILRGPRGATATPRPDLDRIKVPTSKPAAVRPSDTLSSRWFKEIFDNLRPSPPCKRVE